MPCHYTLASIAHELLVAGHPHRALVVCHAVERLEHLEREHMKFTNIIEKKNARIAELEQQVANSVPFDAKDMADWEKYDDEGNAVPKPPPNDEELAAQLKASADGLTKAVESNQP